MGKTLFVCNCGETMIKTDHNFGRCGKCKSQHCMDCHKKFFAQFGGDENKYLANCDECAYDKSKDYSDDESEEESEDESEDESDESEDEDESEKSVKPKTKPAANFIWKASVGFEGESEDVYFKNRDDAVKHMHNKLKELLEDDKSYDKDGSLFVDHWELGLNNYILW